MENREQAEPPVGQVWATCLIQWNTRGFESTHNAHEMESTWHRYSEDGEQSSAYESYLEEVHWGRWWRYEARWKISSTLWSFEGNWTLHNAVSVSHSKGFGETTFWPHSCKILCNVSKQLVLYQHKMVPYHDLYFLDSIHSSILEAPHSITAWASTH